MDTVDLVKEKIDIVDFIGEYVRLAAAGRNFKGLCPFHQDKAPSFVVSPDRQIWHCFGCSKGGDLLSFLMQYENVEFIEALKILADRAGVDMQLRGSKDQKQFSILYDINALAATFYQAALKSPGGASAKKYVKDRGLNDETIEEFKIGVSGSKPDSLMAFLTKKGYKISDIERSGLVFKSRYGNYRDFFRERIMFPITNHFGKVVAFTGRLLPEHEDRKDIGKYVNSRESDIFNKSKILFGFHKSKDSIRQEDTAILVEGQMDFLLMYQIGIKNVTASSGTAFSDQQLSVLRKRAENLVLAFDADSAGKMAAQRIIDSAWQQDFNVRVLKLDPEVAKDPADMVKEDAKKMKELVTKAEPVIEFYFDYYGFNQKLDMAGKKKAIRSLLERVKNLKSSIEQSQYLEQIALRSGMATEVLKEELMSMKNPPRVRAKTQEEKAGPEKVFGPREATLNRLIALTLLDQGARKIILEKLSVLPESYQKIFNYLNGEKGKISIELQELADLIQLQSSFEPSDPDKMDDEIEKLFERLGDLSVKDKRQLLKQKIQIAEQKGDEVTLEKALKEYRDLK